MSYDAFMERARYLLSERKARLRAERDEQNLFAPHAIAASEGRAWRRIVSIADLRRLGRDLRNCLSGQCGNRYGYVQRLCEDMTRFWALYDAAGVARAALAIETQSGRVSEARGFRNAPYALEGADFEALVAAGMCQRPPPDAAARILALRPDDEEAWRRYVAPHEEERLGRDVRRLLALIRETETAAKA